MNKTALTILLLITGMAVMGSATIPTSIVDPYFVWGIGFVIFASAFTVGWWDG